MTYLNNGRIISPGDPRWHPIDQQNTGQAGVASQQQAAWQQQNQQQLAAWDTQNYAQTKHKRNKRILVVGGIGGGAIGGTVALGILAAEHVAVYGGVTLRLISGAVAGTIVGTIVGAISLVVIRILAGEEALAFSGGKETGIVTIAGIVAGATILVPLVTPFVGQFGLLAPCVVAVVAGLIAGALVAGKVRKRPPRRGYVRDR